MVFISFEHLPLMSMAFCFATPSPPIQLFTSVTVNVYYQTMYQNHDTHKKEKPYGSCHTRRGSTGLIVGIDGEASSPASPVCRCIAGWGSRADLHAGAGWGSCGETEEQQARKQALKNVLLHGGFVSVVT